MNRFLSISDPDSNLVAGPSGDQVDRFQQQVRRAERGRMMSLAWYITLQDRRKAVMICASISMLHLLVFSIFEFSLTLQPKTAGEQKRIFSISWVTTKSEGRPRLKMLSDHVKKNEQKKSFVPTSNVNKLEQVRTSETVAAAAPLQTKQDDPLTKSSSNLTTNAIEIRYGLKVPTYKEKELEGELTPAQQAARDVRSNSVKLSKYEKFAQTTGALDCVFQARSPDGKIIREPGRWVEVAARSEPGQPKNIFKARFCVRFHQNPDQDGNDLTDISAGLRGK